jgi:DNA-binding transcriptional MocR family regulator
VRDERPQPALASVQHERDVSSQRAPPRRDQQTERVAFDQPVKRVEVAFGEVWIDVRPDSRCLYWYSCVAVLAQYPGIERTSRAIAEALEAAITEGRLAPGDRLPSVRRLAAELRTSPGTVASAFAELRRRGLILTEERSATRVSLRPPIRTPSAFTAPAGARDLSSGNPDPRLLPPLEWAWRDGPPPVQLYGAEPVFAPLLELTRREFERSGIDAATQMVVSGAVDGIERALSAALRPGDRVLVEDPGYANLIDLLRAMGFVPVGVPLDDEGPLPEPFGRRLGEVSAVIVTPRAQNPTGACLTKRRARRLRAMLASDPDLLVIENDHSATIGGPDEYHSLIGERHRQWVVTRSFSKMFSPDLRIAVIAGSPSLVAKIEGRQLLAPGWVSGVLQQLSYRLLINPRTSRLLVRAQATYRTRREALLEALRERGMRAHGASGLNVYIPVPEEAAALQGLLARGWALKPGASYRLGSAPFLRATTAALEPAAARRLAQDVADVLGPARRSRVP